MIRSSVVDGVMSFAEMEGMMYKIEGEDLYLIGTSEHSMIGKFKDTILEEKIFHIHILHTHLVSVKKKVLTVLKNVVYIVFTNSKTRNDCCL